MTTKKSNNKEGAVFDVEPLQEVRPDAGPDEKFIEPSQKARANPKGPFVPNKTDDKNSAVRVIKTRKDAEMPVKATDGSAGYDVKVCLAEGDMVKVYSPASEEREKKASAHIEHDGEVGFVLESRERAMIPTGLSLDIDEGFWVGCYSRSGLSIKKGVSLVNGVGVIDSDYTGELMALVINHSTSPVFISNGLRVFQMIPHRHGIDIETAENGKQKKTGRGSKGFGSTGEK